MQPSHSLVYKILELCQEKHSWHMAVKGVLNFMTTNEVNCCSLAFSPNIAIISPSRRYLCAHATDV